MCSLCLSLEPLVSLFTYKMRYIVIIVIFKKSTTDYRVLVEGWSCYTMHLCLHFKYGHFSKEGCTFKTKYYVTITNFFFNKCTHTTKRVAKIQKWCFWFVQGVSVEAVDPVFQAKMLDMLKQTGRPEMVVGWYHSHPGFGCWLSGNSIVFPISCCIIKNAVSRKPRVSWEW